MELLDQLEAKITLALETIELLNMENEELKQELDALKLEKTQTAQQHMAIEEKITKLISQFNHEAVDALLAANS
ncbi:hypothetical protein NBRC116188_24310 [Oceaniserpentilla sp. 4NH20-0058]|uniref:cell division protein ZapB n=1 Tax=Oceaniserpentilla sp. 4NH20-0058 TaxID=3127660 RepID=UPI003105D28B